MSYLYLSNCLLCGAALGDASIGHVNYFYCSKDTDHFSYDMTRGLIETKHDYGRFQFTIKDKEVTCAIFYNQTDGEKIWMTEDGEKPKAINIPKIIEKFEIHKLFK